MKTIALLLLSTSLISSNLFGQLHQDLEMSKNDYYNNSLNELSNQLIGINELSIQLDEPLFINRDILDLWRLDSTVLSTFYEEPDSILGWKSILTYYDETNTVETILSMNVMDGSGWLNLSRSLLKFNESDLQIQAIYYKGDDSIWLLREKRDYIYNENNYFISEIKYAWDSINEVWLNSFKTEFNINDVGIADTIIHYTTDPETNDWQRRWLWEYDYNQVGQEIKRTTSRWNNDETRWFKLNKHVFTYNSGIKSEFFYTWDSTNWKQTAKTLGIRISNLTEQYNGYKLLDDSTWFHETKEELRYDDSGNLVFSESHKFYLNDSVWKGRIKQIREYNELGQLINIINHDWRSALNDWVLYYLNHYKYDDNGIYYYRSTSSWIELENTWHKNMSEIFYFSNTSSINEHYTNNIPIQVYPNPCTTKITLDFDNIDQSNVVYKIYSLSGRIIDEGIIDLTKTISVRKLKRGQYLIKLVIGKMHYIGKFIKL